MGTRHLIECGCKRIVHITGPLSSCVVQDRLTGYKEELTKENIEIDEALIVEALIFTAKRV